MRRAGICLFLLVFAFAGLGEASAHRCCRSQAAPRHECAKVAAMPCCPPPCAMRSGSEATPALPETAAALRSPVERPVPAAAAAIAVVVEPQVVIATALYADRLPTRPPRCGLALRRALLI